MKNQTSTPADHGNIMKTRKCLIYRHAWLWKSVWNSEKIAGSVEGKYLVAGFSFLGTRRRSPDPAVKFLICRCFGVHVFLVWGNVELAGPYFSCCGSSGNHRTWECSKDWLIPHGNFLQYRPPYQLSNWSKWRALSCCVCEVSRKALILVLVQTLSSPTFTDLLNYLADCLTDCRSRRSRQLQRAV